MLPTLRLLLSRISRVLRAGATTDAEDAAARVRSGVVTALVLAAVLLAFGGIPGSLVRFAPPPAPQAPSAPPTASDQADGRVDATVQDAADGHPLPGASVHAVTVADDGATITGTAAADASGIAHLTGLPRGETWIVADARGHARASTQIVIDREARATTLALGPEHTIDVAAKDETAAPLAEAEVQVVSPADPLPVGARAGDDGVAHVGRLSGGPWRIVVRKAGFEPATARASTDGERVAVVLRKLGAIAVHVAGEDGVGAAGARVVVASAMLWPQRVAETDEHGDVRLGALSAGAYALRATKGATASPIELGVALSRGEEKAVLLTLGPGRFVAVRVTDGTGDDADPVPAARVTLAEGGLSPFPIEGSTDTKGRVRLGPIAPGDATVTARADGFVPRGALAVADPPPPETRVALVRAGVLSGRVVDGRGYPVVGATIEIAGTDLNGGPIFDDPRRTRFQAAHFDAMLSGPVPLVPAGELGVTPGPVPPIPHGVAGADLLRPGASLGGPPDPSALAPAPAAEPWVTLADGTFRASPASPGRIRAIVRHPEYVEAESDVVSLAPGGDTHVDVVMRAGGILEGRVLDARDRPVEGARVVASATRGSLERSTTTASDGTFAFAALPESISLTARAEDDDDADLRLPVTVPEGGRKEITLHLPEARDPLPVHVVDDRGSPVADAQVSASSLETASPLRTTAFSDANGEAAIRRAKGLALRVEVRAPGHAPRVVTTDPGADALRVELAPGESATGEVTTSRGAPIAGAEVALHTDLGVRRARTDARGVYAVSDLPSGPLRLTVRVPAFAAATQSTTIPDSGGRRPFTIATVELTDEGRIEGVVVDARGDPVAGARVAQGHAPTWLLVGATPERIATTDARGRFALGELAEGTVTIEAYAPEVGRGRVESVNVVAGRTTDRVHVVLGGDAGGGDRSGDGAWASGNVAITLGEAGAPAEVVVVSVAEGSEAERAGLAPGDVLTSVDGAAVETMGDARAKLAGPAAVDVVVGVRRGGRVFVLRIPREAVRR